MKYIEYKEKKQQGTYEFPLAFYEIEPASYNYQMPYHWHPEYEIIRITEGIFHLTIDGRRETAQKNDIFFIHSGVLHGGVPLSCSYQCIVFDMKLLLGGNHICNHWFQKLLRNEFHLPVRISGISRQIDELLIILFGLLAEQKKGYEFMTQSIFYQLFGQFSTLEHKMLQKDVLSAPSRYINRLKEVFAYIEAHYTELVTLEDMAEAAGLNPRYFCRFFGQLTGRTPIEYLNYYRIECACNLLMVRELSVTDVAYRCGFNDSSYFIKVFHDTKGMTPKQYRKIEGNPGTVVK